MTTRCTALLAIAAAGLAGGPAAGAAKLLHGSYEVDVRLDLPNVQDTGARKTVTVCRSARERATHGLAALSDNNPLAGCPATNALQIGDVLTFDIVCGGPNGARATATYTLGTDRFRGRIVMTMGGKNMTMTETQHGRRVGDCAPGAKSR